MCRSLLAPLFVGLGAAIASVAVVLWGWPDVSSLLSVLLRNLVSPGMSVDDFRGSLAILGGVVLCPENGSMTGFQATANDAILGDLQALEPNWRWSLVSGADEVRPFIYSGQPLQSAWLTRVRHSAGLQAVARRDTPLVSFFFVLTGNIQISDRRARTLLSILPNHLASVRTAAGDRISIQDQSSWLALHISEQDLRRSFEDLTGTPYMQEFVLPLTHYSNDSPQGLYQTLRQAQRDLASSSEEVRSMLGKAYQQLALVKLFSNAPRNLVATYRQSKSGDVPARLLKAEAFMRANLTAPLTIEDLAVFAGCSPRELQRLFLTNRGRTPMGVLCNYRLAAAHGAIKEGRVQSITDLALSLQFSNPGRFSALYKAAYGLKPSLVLRFAHSEE
ncbi:helix-turn-helix transcriptional regulator [Ensifer adhaerens]|uniref:Helix-turn-helix transcriptional regulator n=1 Tax=Ensifer adhaerens TaxID=106592 RepID=A0A9Q8YFR3_ENSAD|nr:helix-turn-helix transcriptional regulator [Ensifer adhaerens]USJ27721.1 helix-turn-helix transcriptional regulator [Ensifer adhaerens]